MSSACVCHTDEWCFYCNMYSPLEKEHSRLKGEIQRVIDELEKRRIFHKTYIHRNIASAYGEAIQKLKELIPSEVSDPRNTSKHE